MNAQKPNKLPIILNIVFFLLTVTVNGLANTVRIGGRLTGEISDSIPNLFVPAGITFAVWGVIYLLLLGFTVYQARGLFRADERLRARLRSIGVLFIVSCVLNAAWIFAWHYLLVGLSLAIMLGLLVTLIILYQRLNAGPGKPTLPEAFFVYAPFSVYLGWICVATIANITAVLVTLGWNGFGLGEAFWTVVMLGAALAVALAGLLLRGDAAFGLVFAWAFLGIYLKRAAPGTAFVPEVAYTALIASILTAVGVILALVRKAVKNLKAKPVLP